MTTLISKDKFQALPKAQLKYDRFWHCSGNKNNVLDNLVSNISRLNIVLAQSCQLIQVDHQDELEIEPATQTVEVVDVVQDTLYSMEMDNSQYKIAELSDTRILNTINKDIQLYQEEEQKIVQNNIRVRESILKENLSLIYHQTAQKFKQFQMHREEELNSQAFRMIKEIEKQKEESKMKAESFKEIHKQHAMMLAAKSWRIEEETKRKEREKKQKLEIIFSIQKDMNEIYSKILDDFRSCQQQHSFYSSNIHSLCNKIKSYCDEMECIASQVKTQSEIKDELVHKIQQLFQKTEQQHALFDQEIENLIAKSQIAAEEKIGQKAEITSDVNDDELEKEGDTLCDNFSQGTFEIYMQLISRLNTVTDIVNTFSHNPSNKKIKFSLQKASVVLINKLAKQHVHDSFRTLTILLQGGSVNAGGSLVTTSCHQDGLLYCQYVIANCIVKQGEETVSVNPEAAYPLAAIAVSLSSRFPEFGQLLKATLFCKCPYLAPLYLHKKDGMSTEEYHKSLGYVYRGDKLETEVQFLKRMSGIAHLYGAMAQAHNQAEHIFTINNIWTWFAEILNMNPQPNITATVIYDILVTSGWLLSKTYGHQFKKLLHILCKDFFIKLRDVTPKDCYGPLKRLELFLHKALQKGSIPLPKGHQLFKLI